MSRREEQPRVLAAPPRRVGPLSIPGQSARPVRTVRRRVLDVKFCLTPNISTPVLVLHLSMLSWTSTLQDVTWSSYVWVMPLRMRSPRHADSELESPWTSTAGNVSSAGVSEFNSEGLCQLIVKFYPRISSPSGSWGLRGIAEGASDSQGEANGLAGDSVSGRELAGDRVVLASSAGETACTLTSTPWVPFS